MNAIDRRLLIKLAALGTGALAVPGAAQIVAARGFTHGVASGEPSANSVLLWTRFVSSSGEARLTAEIADTLDFARVVAGGSVTASAMRDHTAKIVVDGLAPGRWYYFRFVAPDGSVSCTGRTRTLPEGDADQFRLGVFSCSNIGFGWFNAYADAARRGDIDLAVHLGDYIYEYPQGSYPERPLPGREMLPLHATVALADYRLRYASYRSDAALQQLHQQMPMIAMWDDHEFANDAWSGGAENHNPDSEGDWMARRRAALQAWQEWMPVSDARWRSYQIGTLATIALPDTRIIGRDQPHDYQRLISGLSGGELGAALARFRDGDWQDTARSMLGAEQEAWIEGLIAGSARAGTRWQIVAQQVIMGRLNAPRELSSWIPADAPEIVRRRASAAAMVASAGLPLNLDAWDGYPAARARLLGAAQAAGANLVVLTGDSHNGWGFNLDNGGRAAGVEFATPGVTSPGIESYFPVPPATVAAALRSANPALNWVDTSRRGYLAVTLTPDQASSEWRMWDSVRSPETAMATTANRHVLRGRNQLAG